MDIFACSMAKKGAIIMKKNDDIFACSMAKKSGTIMMKNDSKITLSTGNERKSA